MQRALPPPQDSMMSKGHERIVVWDPISLTCAGRSDFSADWLITK